MQFHVNFRHCLLKRAQRRRQDLCPKYRRIANVQFSFTALRKGVHFWYRFVCSLQYRSCFFEKQRSRLTQTERFAVRSNNCTPSGLLQITDLPTHGRLRNVKFLRRSTQDVLSLCHSDEVTKVPQFHSHRTMPSRHIETRNIVFHIGTGSNGLLCMMKTELPTNGELPIPKERDHRRSVVIQHNRSEHVEAEDSSGKDKKTPLFRRPGVIIAAAILAIVGIGYGGIAMFHSFTHESTDDAFVDAHIILTAPKIAGRVATVHIDDNQDVKKGRPVSRDRSRGCGSGAGASGGKAGSRSGGAIES